MKYFQGFMEDYNTATMPHEKFYNYERWEIAEYAKSSQRTANADTFTERSAFDDEKERRAELKARKEAAERKEFESLKGQMAANKNLQENMRYVCI